MEEQDPNHVNFVGPFERHDVVVDGWRVPLLEAHPEGEHGVLLVLDRRIGVGLKGVDEIERIVPFIADAIAVSLGYGAHPRGERRAGQLDRVPYPRPERVVEISGISTAASSS